MAQQNDYIEHLSRTIGARPAGTEEEQQAALYIADAFQSEAGFPVAVEDFTSSSNVESPRAICSILSVVVALIAVIFPPFAIPAAIIALLSAGLYVAESIGHPVVTKALAKGASQNVVAKYVPGTEEGKRSRKIVLVAHYDTGKVKPRVVSAVEQLPIPWPLVCMVAMIIVPVLLLLRATVFGGLQGAALIVLNVFIVLAAIFAALPAVKTVLYRMAPFSEGANDNASGVSAMLEVAKTISHGLMNSDEIDENFDRGAVIHGEEAALAEDLVPEGAELTYHASKTVFEEDGTPQERLSAAKAAIAALTGEAVSTTTYVKEQPAEEPVVTIEDGIKITEIPTGAAALADNDAVDEAPHETAAEAAEVFADAPSAPASAASAAGVPDWFAEAQRKAKRSPQKPKPAQRSRYAEVLDAALESSNAIFDEANKLVADESEERLRARSADIVEVLPPLPGEGKPAQKHDPSTVITAGAPMYDEEFAAARKEGASIEAAPGAQPSQASDAQAQDETSPAAQGEAPAAEAEGSIEVPVVAQSDDFAAGAEDEAAAEAVAPVAAGSASTVDLMHQFTQEVASLANETKAFEPIVFTPEELAAGGVKADNAAAPVAAEQTPEHPKRSIDLPSLDTAADAAPDFQVQGQRAPLAAASSADVARGLASTLPSVAGPGMAGYEQTAPSKSGALRSLRTKLPSLSGSIERVGEADIAVSSVSTVGSFGAAGATGSIEPVGDELFQDYDNPDDVYVDDADDSDIEDQYTETGAFAGPDYVEMPKSRVRRFLDKFHFGSKKKNVADEETPQEWLDVEDEFDPRAVGKERGGWESFQGEQIKSRRAPQNDEARAYEAEYGDYAEDSYDEYSDSYAEDVYGDEWDNNDRRWQGGSMSRVKLGRVNMKSSSEEDEADAMAALDEDVETPEEIKHIYQFRNPNFETEVWFVALGSEVDSHDGIRAFVQQHESELRGSVIVDLEALGAGSLSYAQREGAIKSVSPSSRGKRFVQKASRESGVPCAAVNLSADSAASVAMAMGVQALHIVGIENGQKALTSADEDVIENIDQQTLRENTYFVEELVKNI